MNFKQKITPLHIAGTITAVAGTVGVICAHVHFKHKKAAYEAKHKTDETKKIASHKRTRG